jgi:uncharacterized damage-inducible protein DinB
MQAYLEKISQANEKLLQTVGQLTEEQVHAKYANSEWTILEILEHCFISELAILKVFQEIGTVDNAPISNINHEKVTAIMQNRANKINAPEIVKPKGRFKTLAEGIAAIQRKRAEIADLATKINWQDGATFPHPVMGNLTKADWLHFGFAHTARHLEQINEYVGKK